MPRFTVCVRAIRHLTAELTIDADTPMLATSQAEKLLSEPGGVEWDETYPEDEQVESVQVAE